MKKVVNLIKYFFIGVYTIIICPFKYLIIGIMYVFMPRKRKELQYKGKPLVHMPMLLSDPVYMYQAGHKGPELHVCGYLFPL